MRKRIGLIYLNDDEWIAGTYYITNLIHALNVLNENEKPEIVAFSNADDFDKLQKETNYPYLTYDKYVHGKPNAVIRIINRITSKSLKKVLFQRQYKGHLDALFLMQRSGYLDSISIERRIYWIADFQDRHYPEFFTNEGLIDKHRRSQWVEENAKKLIVSSLAVEKDWLRFYSNYKGLIKIVHFAVKHPDYENLNIDKLKAKYNLPDEYYFTPNQFWAHKNHILVIKAAEILKKQGNPIVFAFSGKESDNRNPNYTEKLKEYVKEKNLNDVIRFLGFLDRKEQLKLMKYANAIIQPSLFEGWSTVIEDAMAMNQRVLASDLDVNKEQLGSQGFYFNPHYPNELVKLISAEVFLKHKPNYNYTYKILKFAESFNSLIDS